jgi:hypothetical protein
LKTILLALFFTCNMLYAYTYDQKILQIHAKIAPRILYMNESKKPNASQILSLVIVYESGDVKAAKELSNYINASYPNGLGDKTIKIETVSYASFKSAPENSLIFLLDAPDDKVTKIVNYAQKNRLMSMSYQADYLDKNVLISLYIGKTLKPYLNIEVAKKSGIVFSSTLMSVSKIYNARKPHE